MLKNSATWIFSFIPLVPAKKLGLLIGITLTMVPGILAEWKKIRDAQVSRGIELSADPLRRITAPFLPLLVNSILKAEITASALETRGYTGKEEFSGKYLRKNLGFKWKKKDSLLYSVLLVLLLLPLHTFQYGFLKNHLTFYLLFYTIRVRIGLYFINQNVEVHFGHCLYIE